MESVLARHVEVEEFDGVQSEHSPLGVVVQIGGRNSTYQWTCVHERHVGPVQYTVCARTLHQELDGPVLAV